MEKVSLLCKICNASVILVDEFFLHNYINHQDVTDLTCPFNKCIRFYSNKKSLKNHIHGHYNFKQNPKTILDFDNSKDIVQSSSLIDKKKRNKTATVRDII